MASLARTGLPCVLLLVLSLGVLAKVRPKQACDAEDSCLMGQGSKALFMKSGARKPIAPPPQDAGTYSSSTPHPSTPPPSSTPLPAPTLTAYNYENNRVNFTANTDTYYPYLVSIYANGGEPSMWHTPHSHIISIVPEHTYDPHTTVCFTCQVTDSKGMVSQTSNQVCLEF